MKFLGLGWEMLGDISYDEATLKSEVNKVFTHSFSHSGKSMYNGHVTMNISLQIKCVS